MWYYPLTLTLHPKERKVMPKWLRAVIILGILFIFIIPNPVEAGIFFGDVFNALITFCRSFADAFMY
jgi:hypothetical protein